ncbi:hypothetical protein ES703_71712 [subsurface metagenome]
MMVTVKLTFSPGVPLFSGGDIETSTPLSMTALAMQVALSLISAFSVDVAVTVISSSSSGDTSPTSGIMTVSVAVLLSPIGTESEVGETLGVGDQSASSLTVRS